MVVCCFSFTCSERPGILYLLPLCFSQSVTAGHTSTSAARQHVAKCPCRYGPVCISLSIYTAPAQTGAVFLCLDLFPPKQLVFPDNECACSFFSQQSSSNYEYGLNIDSDSTTG